MIIGLRPGSNGLRSDKRRKNVPQNNNQFVVNVRALTEHSAAAAFRNAKQSAFEVSPRRHRHHTVSLVSTEAGRPSYHIRDLSTPTDRKRWESAGINHGPWANPTTINNVSEIARAILLHSSESRLARYCSNRDSC